MEEEKGRGYGHAAVFSECKPPFAVRVLWEITASTNLSLQTTSLRILYVGLLITIPRVVPDHYTPARMAL